jgi:cyclophilin family peptidyl-prolyl cis-trans isomerase
VCRVRDTGSSTKLPCVQGEGYRKCTFHRIQPNFMVQGGDFTQEGPIPILHIIICDINCIQYVGIKNRRTNKIVTENLKNSVLVRVVKYFQN